MIHTALRRVTSGLFILSVPALAAPLHATPAFAVLPALVVQGDAKDMMEQGLDALRRGDDAGALEKFRAIVASNPGNEDAWRIWKEVDQAVWVKMLAKGGEFEQIARALLAKATPSMGQFSKDGAVIDPLVEQALDNDFGKRQQALAKLAGNHGPYTIQHLVGPLSDAGNDDRRIRAMEAAYRMGGVGVPALVTLLSSADTTARRSAIVVLGRLKDARGMARIAQIAESDGDSVVRAEAKAVAGSMGDAATALVHESMMYLRLDYNFVRPTDSNDVVWDLVDGKLVDSPVPRAMFGVEMARRAALQSLAAKADNPRALGALAMAQAEGRLLINGLSEEHAKAMNEKLPAMNEELRLCGSGAIVHGLHMAIEMGDSRLACELIKEAADTTTPGDSHSAISLAEAAMKSMNREVRLSGAAAAAFICHKAAGREDIAKLLAEAVGERVQRIAVVIDENSERSHSLKSSFEGARWYAAASDSGISGLARIRRFPGCDVILISDSLKDITAEELITELRTDDRTKNVPIFALSTDKNVEGAKARFGDKVKGVLAKFDGAAMDAAVEGSKLNSERMRAEELASLAAMGLAHAAEIADGARADVLAACADAAGGRADTVRVPAIEVLGRFGGDAQQGALAGVLKSENASSVAKATAAMALSSLGARGVALNAETMNALEAALSDADAGVRSSAATAIGRAPNLDAAARAALIARKQMPLTVGAGAPAGGGSN